MNSTERKRPTWDEYGMLLAYTAAQRSPDPYVIVGAAAFRSDMSTVATGYNGALPGVEIDWTDRDARRPKVIHAECNCLKYTRPGEVHYLYVTMLPCARCLDLISEYRVKEVVYATIYDKDCSSLTRASKLGINIRQLNLSNELLKKYN
jgi:deoxycytidylate deaminase